MSTSKKKKKYYILPKQFFFLQIRGTEERTFNLQKKQMFIKKTQFSDYLRKLVVLVCVLASTWLERTVLGGLGRGVFFGIARSEPVQNASPHGLSSDVGHYFSLEN